MTLHLETQSHQLGEDMGHKQKPGSLPYKHSNPAWHQPTYDTDFVAWADRMAQILKEKRFDKLDLDNLIEEVQDLANRHRDALRSQLTRLLTHLLKWQFQPNMQTGSWSGSIKEARKRIRRLLRDYPSLKNHLRERLSQCYQDAIEDAVDDTGLPTETFPAKCPYTAERILDNNFWPTDYR